MSTRTCLVIKLQAHPGDAEQTTRAFEAFGRTAAGLALEGIYVRIAATTIELDDTEVDSERE